MSEEYIRDLQMNRSRTVVVLEDIKAEIKALPNTYPFTNHLDAYVKEADVMAIIDKHIGGENED